MGDGTHGAVFPVEDLQRPAPVFIVALKAYPGIAAYRHIHPAVGIDAVVRLCILSPIYIFIVDFCADGGIAGGIHHRQLIYTGSQGKAHGSLRFNAQGKPVLLEGADQLKTYAGGIGDACGKVAPIFDRDGAVDLNIQRHIHGTNSRDRV